MAAIEESARCLALEGHCVRSLEAIRRLRRCIRAPSFRISLRLMVKALVKTHRARKEPSLSLTPQRRPYSLHCCMDGGKGWSVSQQYLHPCFVGGIVLQAPQRLPSRSCRYPKRSQFLRALIVDNSHTGVMNTRDQHMDYISQSIREIPDWPKKGILFQDITSMLLDAKARSPTLSYCILHNCTTFL